MGQFTVRNIEHDVIARLKRRAAAHGISMETEVRQILRKAVEEDGAHANVGLGSRIAARFARAGLTEPLPELKGQGPVAGRRPPASAAAVSPTDGAASAGRP